MLIFLRQKAEEGTSWKIIIENQRLKTPTMIIPEKSSPRPHMQQRQLPLAYVHLVHLLTKGRYRVHLVSKLASTFTKIVRMIAGNPVSMRIFAVPVSLKLN